MYSLKQVLLLKLCNFFENYSSFRTVLRAICAILKTLQNQDFLENGSKFNL